MKHPMPKGYALAIPQSDIAINSFSTVSYLNFITGENVLTIYSQVDKVHADKVWKIKEKFIIIYSFKTDVLLIIGGVR